MGTEIERKYKVKYLPELPRQFAHIRQGYLNLDKERTTRIRIADYVNRDSQENATVATVNFKGKKVGISAPEFEFNVPLEDGFGLYNMAIATVEKVRYRIPFGSLTIELDVFGGYNEGLVIAEIELPDEDTPVIGLPDWIGEEVSGKEYQNANLATWPYKLWEAPKMA